MLQNRPSSPRKFRIKPVQLGVRRCHLLLTRCATIENRTIRGGANDVLQLAKQTPRNPSPDAKTLGSAGTASTAGQSRPAAPMSGPPASGTARADSDGSSRTQRSLRSHQSGSPVRKRTLRALQWGSATKTRRCLHRKLHETADGRRGNLDAASVFTGHCRQFNVFNLWVLARNAHKLLAREPRMGSKIRISGFDSWFSR